MAILVVDCDITSGFTFYLLKKEKNTVSSQPRALFTIALNSVADPGPLMLGVLDRWTMTINILLTLIR